METAAATLDVPPTQVKIGELGNLGADAYMFKALPDGESVDVTPSTPRQSYTFVVYPTKHTPAIQASTSEQTAVLEQDRLVDGSTFCVGQKVTFQVAWDRAPQTSTQVYGWLMSPKFYNHSWQSYYVDPAGIHYYGSLNFDTDSTILQTSSPWAWWVSGGRKNVAVDLSLSFGNGQVVKLRPQGCFAMRRPHVVRIEPQGHFGAGIDRSEPVVPYLSLVNGPMSFKVYISKTYPGTFGLTQLINFYSQTYISPLILWWASTYGNWCLDGDDEYYDSQPVNLTTWPSDDEYPTPCRLDDTPGSPLITTLGSYDGAWKTYVRFTPVGAGSIPVTIGRVDWSWAATALWYDVPISDWRVTDDGVGPPTLRSDDQPPYWQEVQSGRPEPTPW